MDNIFVFVIIFGAFQVPAAYQHRVLFWGIFGALIMRAVFIFAGISLITKFHWIIYIFGAFLIFTGIKIARDKGTKINVEKSPVINLIRRYIPVTSEYFGTHYPSFVTACPDEYREGVVCFAFVTHLPACIKRHCATNKFFYRCKVCIDKFSNATNKTPAAANL